MKNTQAKSLERGGKNIGHYLVTALSVVMLLTKHQSLHFVSSTPFGQSSIV